MWTLTTLSILLVLIGLVDGDRMVWCERDGVWGYSSLDDLNRDIADEMNRVHDFPFMNPQGSYEYTLCGHTVFDATEYALTPLLSHSRFVCSSEHCTISGGKVQMNLLHVPAFHDRYPMEEVSFHGLTFQGFTTYSIAALATGRTSAKFYNCHWKVCLSNE